MSADAIQSNKIADVNVERHAIAIDDLGPFPVFLPRSVTEVGALVRESASKEQAIYPLGGRTMLDYGLPPTRPGVAVDLTQLDEIIDYPARDMTITVQAGISIAKLQALLATENQRLPVDVPLAERATLGGAIATNTSGLRRFGFGTLRDYVIGISVINDEGQEVKAGGRVVKNVAGYDLCKLYVGSLGTLGIITQATLKLKPLPEERALVTLCCEAAAVESLLELLHRSRTRPVCIELLNRAGIGSVNRRSGPVLPESPWVIIAGFEDNREAVHWQLQKLLEELPPGTVTVHNAHVGQASEPFWQALIEFPANPDVALTFKANLLPSRAASFCLHAGALSESVQLQAHAGNGIVIGHVAADLTLEAATTMLKALHQAAQAAQGNVVLLRCPPAWKATLPVWGVPRNDAWLMRAVKEKLDPRGLFNPGRFVDGI